MVSCKALVMRNTSSSSTYLGISTDIYDVLSEEDLKLVSEFYELAIICWAPGEPKIGT